MYPVASRPGSDNEEPRISSIQAQTAGGADTQQPTLAEELLRRTGRNPARCYQCGKCSAGCPMASETDHRPHDVLRLAGLDRREQLLASESLWLCLGCETCTARCPNDCDPAGVIDTLKAMAVEQTPEGLPKPFSAFHHAFLDQIKAHGRISELGMMVSYKLRSGAFFADATAGPGMVSRGKLHLKPPRIAGVDEVRAIFKACEEEGQ